MPEKIRPRMHRRIPIESELAFTGDIEGTGVLLEMSEGGLSFLTDTGCETGQHLRARIGDEEETFCVEGTIVAVNDEGDRLRCSLSFSSMPASASIAMRSFIQRHRFSRFRL